MLDKIDDSSYIINIVIIEIIKLEFWIYFYEFCKISCFLIWELIFLFFKRICFLGWLLKIGEIDKFINVVGNFNIFFLKIGIISR